MSNEKVVPGIHPSAKIAMDEHFTEKEKEIAKIWKKEWFITFASNLKYGQVKCNYLLVKPTQNLEETLGISREVVVILHPYISFEARALEAFEEVYRLFPNENRIERICYALISKCSDIEEQLGIYSNGKIESQVIIPFTYEDFTTAKNDAYFLRNRFWKYFHSRDLFNLKGPLKKDYYFFGRNEISSKIIHSHRRGENTGLFGLRKTGKTSIIYDIIRKAPQWEARGILIDCENTSFNMKRWNKALFYVVQRVYEAIGIKLKDTGDLYTEADAGYLFEKRLQEVVEKTGNTILLMFDEIENISFGKSASDYWREGRDFVYFWQSIRSAYQHSTDIFTFCLLGTNPKCVEDASILGADNPIFNGITFEFIPGFNQKQIREMVRRLGRLMGITFDEGVYLRLTEDYGGHPFLVRQLCSEIAKRYVGRPVNIDRSRYIAAKEEFDRETDYFHMLIEVLEQFYKDEKEMLILLATGDLETFKYYADSDYSMVKHLLGYGIIKKTEDGDYEFKIDSMKNYLLRINNKVTLAKTKEEKWSAICLSRNEIEDKMRMIVRVTYRFIFKNEATAKKKVIAKIYGSSEEGKRLLAHTYSSLFDPKKNKIYLKNLTELINAEYDYFADYFGNQEVFIHSMDILNCEGRFDAHAKIPDDKDMNSFQAAIDQLNAGIKRFIDSNK